MGTIALKRRLPSLNQWKAVPAAILLLFACMAACATTPEQIRFWVIGGESKLVSPLIASFSVENPDIEVIVQGMSWDVAYEKFVTSVMGDMTPDICQMGTTWMPKFQAMGALLPLDEFLRKSRLQEEHFFQGSLGTCRFGNSLYGIPWYVETRIILYLKSVLSEAGMTRFPTSWDGLLELGRQVIRRRRAEQKPGYFLSVPVNDMSFMMYYWQAGGRINLQPESGTALLEASGIQALSLLQKFLAEGFFPLRENTGVDYITEFANGYYPVAVTGPWMINDLERNRPDMAGKWETSVLPGLQRGTSFVGGSNLAIFRNSRHPEASWRLIQYLSRPDVQVRWFELSNDLPAHRHAWASPVLSSRPFLKTFKAQLEDSDSLPAIPEWEKLGDLISRNITELMNGRMPPQESLSRINSGFQDARTIRRRSLRFFPIGVSVMIVLALGMLYGSVRLAGWYFRNPGFRAGMAFLFLLPAGMLILVFRLLPIIVSFFISLTDWDMYGIADWHQVQFIGIQNYLTLAGDEVFLAGVKNTIIYILIGTPLNVGLALFLALMVDRFSGWKQTGMRLMFFLPVIVTTVAAAMVWQWLYSGIGPLQILFRSLSLEPVPWLTDPRLSLFSLILFSIWKGFGYHLVIFVAALQTIPRQLYEVIAMDGGDEWDCFRHVTLPSMRGTVFLVAVGSVVANLHLFMEPYILTGGGPLNSTMTVMLYTYQQGFKFFKLGYASAMVYGLFLCFVLFNIFQARLRKAIQQSGLNQGGSNGRS